MSSTLEKEYHIQFIKVAAIALAVLIVYFQDLAIIFKNAIEFSSTNITNYILVIPFLLIYVIYRKHKVLIPLFLPRGRGIRLDDTIGLTLIFISLLLYIYGSSTVYALEYHIYSLPIFVAGLTALLFNLQVLRHSIFAIIILVYLLPPPAELLTSIAGDLAWSSASVAEFTLKVYGLDVNLQADYGAPALVISKGDTRTPFFVGEPSSGLFSTIGLSLFALIAVYIARGAIWKRAIMYIIGFPLFFFLNALRISIILLLWYHYGEQVSETFHAVSGPIMAIPGTFIILIIGEKLLRVRISIASIKSDENCKYCEVSKSINQHQCLSCARPFKSIKMDGRSLAGLSIIAIIIINMLTLNMMQVQATSYTNELLKFDVSKINGKERDTVGVFLPEIEGYKLEYAYRDQRVEKVLRQDASLAYRYIKLEGNDDQDLRLPKPSIYAAVQIANTKHRWEDSLLIFPSRLGRPTAEVLELKDVNIDEDTQARFFVYIRPNQKNAEAVLYWIERIPLRFGDHYEYKNVHLILWSYLNTLARNGFIGNENDIRGAEEFYLSLARSINSHWDGVKGELVSMKALESVVTSFPIVMGIASIPAVILSLKEFTRVNASKSATKKIYDRLLDDDKLLIDVVTNLSKEGYATLDKIIEEYSKVSKKSISTSEVMSMLIHARDVGLLKSMLISIDDKPMMVWKSNLSYS